jgi:glucose/arabinose dehydrogenase
MKPIRPGKGFEMKRIRRFGAGVLVAIILAVSGMPIATAQEDEYVPPTSSYDGATVAHLGGEVGEGVEVQLVKVADGLFDPVNVSSANDGTGRLFIVERYGRVKILNPDGTVNPVPFLDISNNVITTGSEQGLLGLAFHPDFATNGLFYVNYTDTRANGDLFIVEYSVSATDPDVADPESGRALLSINDEYRNHNGGTIHFGPDGYLYIAVGDGGLAGDPYNNAQNISSAMGKILRIDVNPTGDAGYAIPDDNPFVGGNGVVNNGSSIQGGAIPSQDANVIAGVGAYRPGALPEIYYLGLRNPWQFSFDSETGDMYIADVGQVAWEEINFIPAGNRGGLNFGWDFMEAGHCYPPEASLPQAEEGSPAAPYGTLSGCSVVGVPPVAEYDHLTGCSITGIGVYRGETYAALDGVYFSADYCSGSVYGLARDDAGVWQFEELLQTGILPTGSGQGEDGALYVTAFDANFPDGANPAETPRGSVWMLVSADQVPDGAEIAPTPAPEEEEVEAPTPTPEASPTA